MKTCLLLLLAAGIVFPAFSQLKPTEKIKAVVTKSEIIAHMKFLAADEMRGRDTGSPEIAIAANYLASQFAIAGLKTPPATPDYFQEVGLKRTEHSKSVDLTLGSDSFSMKNDLLLITGTSFTYDGEIVFVDYGTIQDFEAVDVRGKVVVSYTGSSENSSINDAVSTDSPAKNKLAKEKGALALIELVSSVQVSWPVVVNFFATNNVSLNDPNEVAHLYMRRSWVPGLDDLIKDKKIKGSLAISAPPPTMTFGKNVIGMVDGTDPLLKKEFITLTAHYDHIGVTKKTYGDSINNGARDNALGTTAILEAAKYLVRNPVKRSVVIIAYCGEERGLLGSKWYTEHPVVPLINTVFNMDCDGAGYNDKTIATLIDLNKTTADDMFKKATAAFDLKLKGDETPEQHFYERSDNYNFAIKGVPAVDFSTGIKTFDAEILKYYHRPADEIGTLDFDYLEKFIRAYVYSAVLIGNNPIKPTWKKGDKFEEAGKKLYGGSY